MYSLLSFICFLVVINSQPSADLITNLPGLDFATNYKQYSGYLNLANGHNLHYWFVESQNNPKTDPVTLWLNGGPGCSSLDGLLYELGPFHVRDNGTLYPNPYAWNLNSSVIFLEAPICVGFSYSNDKKCNNSDDQTADDNYHALLEFFKKFPEYINNKFYVTGESYGGVYVPTLTRRIIQGNINKQGTYINLKAFAVGNGLSSYELNDDSSVWFAYHHGLISDSLWNSLEVNCCVSPYTRSTCNFHNSTSVQCKKDVNQVNNVIYGGQLNWYNIYGDCLPTTAKERFPTQKLFHQFKHLNKTQYLDKLKENVPCLDSTGADIYLNEANVRNAIHVSSSPYNWSICVNAENWSYKSQYPTLLPVYKDIFNLDSNIYGIVYNGDTDLACNFIGDEWFVDDLGFKVKQSYREWFTEDNNGKQVAGWTKNYERISFITVRGSGHMVPQYRPPQALKMFQYFLANKELD